MSRRKGRGQSGTLSTQVTNLAEVPSLCNGAINVPPKRSHSLVDMPLLALLFGKERTCSCYQVELSDCECVDT